MNPAPKKDTPAETVLVVTIVMIVAGFLLCLVAWIFYPPLDRSPLYVRLGIGAGAWVLLVPIAWLLTRSKSKARVSFPALVITAAFGFPMFTVGGLGVANAVFDPNPTNQQRTKVLRKQLLHERSNSHPHRLHVQSWRGEEPSYEVIVSEQLWSQVKTGQDVIVVEAPGLFGWVWAADVRLP